MGGGLLPARHFLSFVHPALLPCSRTSDSLRAALTQEDWFLGGNLNCCSALFLLEVDFVTKFFNMVAFFWKDYSSSDLNMLSSFFFIKEMLCVN